MRGAPAPTALPGAVVHIARLQGGAGWAATALCVAAAVVAGLRWLRVAQREHYLPGAASRFARRWWLASPVGAGMSALAVGGVVASAWSPWAALATAAVVAVGPLGLEVRGRTSPLAWTRRLRTLAVASAVVLAAMVVVGWVLGLVPVLAAAGALLVPVLVDVGSLSTVPIENRLAERYVRRAAARLAAVRPTVVAVTGSYGKTSTKGHVAQLVGSSRPLVVSPASFNNRAGLARAVNENLSEGTEVFVAEMGTYGPGEIAELCRWCPPDIAAITAIGPVHLERFGSEDRILEAKSEILEGAATIVLPVDDDRLAALADRVESQGKRVVRCSAVARSVDVAVERGDAEGPSSLALFVAGEPVAKDVPAPPGVQPSNLACAAAIALALGIEPRSVADRLGQVRTAEHRLSVGRAPSGVVVVDDTFNANPAGAAAAIAALEAAAEEAGDGPATAPGASGRRRKVVVTPGMVELGPRQFEENARFAEACARTATDLVVVGRTNRRALLAGVAAAGRPGVAVQRARHRDEAVAWVRANLGPGDVVLYENDLPDHYP